MKYFSVESSDISVPNDWMDDPVRLLEVSWKGKPITGFNQSSRRCYVYPGDDAVRGCCYERKTDQRPRLSPVDRRGERLLLHVPDICRRTV